MKAVVKMLIDFEMPDDIAARRRFRALVDELQPHLPEDGEVRALKIVEDGTGRLIDDCDGTQP